MTGLELPVSAITLAELAAGPHATTDVEEAPTVLRRRRSAVWLCRLELHVWFGSELGLPSSRAHGESNYQQSR